MPQSLHILSAHIIFSTKERQPWLTPKIRDRVWAYQSRILQNLQCNSITIGGVADHVHVLCNLTKKFPTAKVVEILKKDSSKFIKTLGVPNFHWQDGYGLFGVSPSNLEAVRKYILDPEEHHKKETFQDEYLRILKRRSEGGALGYDGSGRWPAFGNWFTLLYSFQKECSLRFRFSEFKCLTELFGRGVTIVQSHLKLADHRIEQVIGR